jgi:redox-sensitive bicupin YhaK (pirin superfamily)
MESDQDEEIEIRTMTDDTRFILLAGKPIDEPIAHYGPFVLSTREEL